MNGNFRFQWKCFFRSFLHCILPSTPNEDRSIHIGCDPLKKNIYQNRNRCKMNR